MPHTRQRLALLTLKRRASYFRVVSIQGARQTGKSFLAKNLIKAVFPHSMTLSLDSKTLRDQAHENPDSFLESYSPHSPLIIDEAQKAPNLFDAVKLRVDDHPKPGQYILLGSTEFSREMKIRESLTGRLGRIRIFPLCYQEVIGVKSRWTCNRSTFLRYIEHGGLPGIMFTRSTEDRHTLFEDWLALVCQRDIHQFQGFKLDSNLAQEILRLCATLEEPTSAAIARKLRQTGRRIQTHLLVLSQLFAIQKINPHPAGMGKPIFLPFDSGVAGHLGADQHRKIMIALMNELLCYNSYQESKGIHLYYYRSRSRQHIDLIAGPSIDECTAYQIFIKETIPLSQLEILKAFKAKVPLAKTVIFGPNPSPYKLSSFSIHPWEEILKRYNIKL